MTPHDSSPGDCCIAELDAALRTLAPPPQPGRSPSAAGSDHPGLSAADRSLATRLMRVNHAGEVAAQALYRGQALVAREPALRAQLLAAAGEERDHLQWCAARVHELGGHTSLLGPFWYLGSLALGAAVGLAGDRASLGFLAETERQVSEHLDSHLQRLPGQDRRSRDIVGRMREDELGHRRAALARGGAEPPAPVRAAMRAAARFMTTVAHFL